MIMLHCTSVLVLCLIYNSILCQAEYSFYDFTAIDIEGKPVPLDIFRGKVLLVVNVASECGFTDSHYKGLVDLQEGFLHTNRFTVLGFPCNQFGGQEPKPEAQIMDFAEQKYDVNFPLFSKVDVKGSNVPDYWRFLIENSGKVPDWNFWKYLVNHKGEVINAWGPRTSVISTYNDVNDAVGKAVQAENEIKVEEVVMEEVVVEDIPVKVVKHDEI